MARGRFGVAAAAHVVLFGAWLALPAAAQDAGSALEVPVLDAGRGVGTPGGEALARLASDAPLTPEMLSEALAELEKMIRDAERVSVLGVEGVDGLLEGVFEVPRGEERVGLVEEINARLSVLDELVSIAERMQGAESRLANVRDAALQTRVRNIQRVTDVVKAAQEARRQLGEGGGGIAVQPSEVELQRSSGRQRFRVVGSGAVSEVSVRLEGMAGVVLEEQDCDGADLAVAGECRVTVGWSGVRTDFPDTAELIVGGVMGDGGRVYGRAVLAAGRGDADPGGGFAFAPQVLEIDSVSGERAVTVRAEEGVAGGIELEVVGFPELTVRENACRGLSLQKGESCLVVMSWEDVRAGTGLGTIVAKGQREDGRRLVSVATVARKLEGQEGARRARAQMVLEPEELAVDAYEGAATVRLRAEGEIVEARFEVVGGAERFVLDAGNCAELPLRDGDMCVMTVSWAGLEEPHDAHGEVVVRGADARGSRIGGSVPIRPGRVLARQVDEEVQRRLEDAEERARIAEERLEIGPSVVGDPDVGLGPVFPDESAILSEEEYQAVSVEEPAEEPSAEVLALRAEQELLREQLRALLEEREDQGQAEAIETVFDEMAFAEREREQLAEYEHRIDRRLRVMAMVRGAEAGADVQLFGWPPEIGVSRLWLAPQTVIEGRWRVSRIDPGRRVLWVFDELEGGLVKIPFGDADVSWWLPHSAAGRLVSPEGLRELREEGRLP